MKTLTAIAALAALILLSGCTGAQIKVTPDVPARVSHTPLPNVGIEDSSVVTIPAAGDIADAFSKELRNSKFAEDVYYPQRPKDPIDVTLETKFSIIEDTHMGAAMAKAFFTGLTLFLLEPAFWYDFDYSLRGEVDVIRDGKRVKHATGQADAIISAKYLSLGEVPKLAQEALVQGKKVVFTQLMNGISR